MIRDHIYTARGPLSAWTVYISWMTPIISFISSILIPLCFGSIEIAVPYVYLPTWESQV